MTGPRFKDQSNSDKMTVARLGKVKIRRDAEAETSFLTFLLRYALRRIGVDVKVQSERFVDYFEGFDQVKAVKNIFGDETYEVLEKLRVEFVSRIGYMGVSDFDGHIIISADYLRRGDLRHVYLDIIHELAHVKQFKEGRKLFDRRYGYTDRPTEIEAYQLAVDEARRIKMTDEEIFRYLKTEWISNEKHKRLAETLHVKPSDQE